MKNALILFALVVFCVGASAQALGDYTFGYSSGSYTEITGGTALGNESTADQRFVDPSVPLGGTATTGVGFPLGFNFYFNGYEFDRMGLCADGWIGLGQSWQSTPLTLISSTYTAPLGTTSGINPAWQVSRVSALGMNINAQTGASIRIETIGTAPYRIFVAQWKGYRKSSSGTGDIFNFQIRLEETTNKVVVVYGTMSNNATSGTAQVGMRGEPATTASNFANRTTTTNWAATTAGTAATNTCTLSSSVYPASGTTFTWTPPAAMNSSYTIGSSGDFTTFAAAVDFLNTNYTSYGIPEGGTIFNVAAGQTFTLTELLNPITATGSVNRPITFQKSGTGANPLLKITGTTATTDAGFRLNGGDYFTFDHIDIQNNTSTTSLEYGFYLVASSYNPCNNNTISYCGITLSRTNTNTKAVHSLGASNAGNKDNTFSDLTIADCNTGLYLYGNSSVSFHNDNEMVSGCTMSDISAYGVNIFFSTNLHVTQNQIGMCAGNSTVFYGIRSNSDGNTAEIDHNTITGNTTSVAAYGLYAESGVLDWHHNEISDFTGTGAADRIGIYVYNYNHQVYDNEIHNISATGNVIGIYTGTYSDNVTIYNNEIHDLSYTGSTTSAYYAFGIQVYGTTVTCANNMIYDLNSTGDTAPMIRGISLIGTGTYNIYYNTIYLKGGGTNASYGSAGIYLYSASSTIDLRNNIVVDLSTPGTGAAGRAAAIWKYYAGFANFASTCDRNIYYAGTPGSKNLICYDSGTSYQTLLDYKNAIATRELGSLTENVPFVSIAEPYDIHVSTTTGTVVEGNALPVSGWDFDFDNNDRNDTNPDIGADEGNFLVPAIVPNAASLISPADAAIVIQPSATLNWTPGSSGGTPTGYRIYFGTNNPPTNIANGIDLGNVSTYNPDPDMAFLTTYYWQIVPYNATGSAVQALCPVWSFETHAAPLTGNYIIGSSGYYPTFTLAIRHLNAAGVGTGGVTFKAIAGEVFAENPITITAAGTAANPITFTSTDTLSTNPRITPTGGTDTYAIQISGGDYITIHHIDVSNAGSATNLVYAYWITGTAGNPANYNTVRNCGIALSRSVTSYGIYLGGAGSHTGNKVLNNTIANAARAIYLISTAECYSTLVQGNTITNTLYGIYQNNATDTQIFYNTVSFPAGATSVLNGIEAVNLVNAHVKGNTISGGSTSSNIYALTMDGTSAYWYDNLVTNLQAGAALEGMNAIDGTAYIYNNTFSALSTTGNTLYGLELSFESGGTAIVYNNKIFNLSCTGTGAYYVQGILCNGTGSKFYNNMIYDLRNPGASTAPQVMGINITGNTASLYHNTFWLNTTGTVANHSSAVVYFSGTATILMNNNIFKNTGTPGASGKSVAFWKTVDGFLYISASTDNNIWYAGTTSAQNLICYTPSVYYQTLDDYKAATATFDQNSLTENTPFVSTSSPYDVHIPIGASTLAESGGVPIAEVTVDYDGEARNASTPDVGADEGTFVIPALAPAPAIVVSPEPGEYAVSINADFTWYASSSGGTPTGYRIYFGSNNPPNNIANGTDLGNVLTWTTPITLDYLTTYYWRIVPYNENGSATGCPVWNFSTHQVPLTGNWIIGSSGYYPDFTHAIRYLNASGVGTGGVTFQAISGEVFAENPPAITVTGTSANPVAFTSTNTSGTNPKITPTGGTGTFGIKLAGGDFFTLDHIDIANAAGSTNLMYGYWLQAQTANGCTDNIIQNCTITLNRTSECYGINSESASGKVNHRNHYLTNTITNARYGIYLNDTTAALNPVVQGNTVTDVTYYGIYSKESNNLTIAYNQITMAASNTVNFYGISCYDENSTAHVNNNTITGATTSGVFNGIYNTYGRYEIHTNTISGVTSTGAIYGIRNYYTGNNYSIYGNTIYNLTATDISDVYGIYVNDNVLYQNHIYGLTSNGHVRGISLGGGTAYNNHIHNLQSNSTGNSVLGMYLSGSTTAYNNMIYDLRNPGSSIVPQVRGINVYTGTTKLYYNSVLLTATGTVASFSTAALYSQSGTVIDLTLKNNIFSDRSTPGASGKSVAFWNSETDFAEFNAASNNNLWYAGTPGMQHLICYYGTTSCQTLEAYKAANIGKDQNSFTENVPFVSSVSPYDLHINPTSQTYVESNALVIATVTNDFDGTPRNASTPDIGADEGNFTEVQLPPTTPVYLSPASGAVDLALNTALAWAAGSGGGSPDYYKIYFGTATPPPLLVANHTSTSYSPAGMLPEHTYYWKIDAVNTLGTATGSIWSFTTRADNTIMEFPYTESFETGNTNGSTTINRWTQALGSGTAYWTANTATNYNRGPRTGSYNVTLAAPNGSSGDAWLFRPIYLTQGQMYGLELYARQYTASGSQAYLQVRLGTAAAVGAMTQTVINIQEFVNGAYQRGYGTFTAASTGIWYLGIHGICTNYINYLSLDDITVNLYIPHPVFSVTPTSKNFGMVNVSETSTAQAFVISNAGDADLIIYQSDIYLDGANTEDFVLTDPGSDLTITPGNTATLYVAFAPQSLGSKTASLVIIDNTGSRATQQIALSGRGIGPLIPPCVEDFEEGWIDWIQVNGTQSNKWELGTATKYRNSYAAYISSNSGATHSYNPNSSSYVHFYHDVTFPADMTGMKLKFEWRGVGEAGFDFLTVHITDTSFVPTAGAYFTEGQIGAAYHSSSDWQLVTLPLSEAYAGQTRRLIFSWRNDGGGGTNPPAAVDNIRIFATWPFLDENLAPTNVLGSAANGIITFTWDTVEGANDYIIEDADMYYDTFTPIGYGYNLFTVPGSYPHRFFRIRATE
jgi:hypothetical protein